MRRTIIVSCIFGILLIGCDLAEPQPRENPPSTPEAVAAVNVESAEPEPVPVEPPTERVEIKQGFTGKGQYGQGSGEKPMDIITVPISQYFSAKERIMLMQLEHTENLYRAANDGKLPDTHEEYMEKIIREGGIKLYDLPPGERYVFDPEQGKLMIEKAK